jgi:UDP-2,4-diacetamido-2,4,6-trideoxy-beta-L-altropyranose hydrolase
VSSLKNKNIVFRTDASNIIGAGHVMRCLTLADALHEQGANCYFICRNHEGNLIDHIKSRGYFVRALPSCTHITPVRNDHHSWLSTSWEQDAQETIAAITALNIKIDWLFADHYGIDDRWHRTLKSYTKKLAVIDDLADRHFCCDVLIDQLCHRTNSDYSPLTQHNTQLLLGSEYAMLRSIFHQVRGQAINKQQQLSSISRVFISMGGTDLLNATLTSLHILKNSDIDRDIDVDILVGQQSDYIEKTLDKKEFAFNIHIHPVTTPVHELMLTADIAIGAGGLTAWERCCLGLPTFLITIAQNQHNAARALEKQKAAAWLGDADNFDEAYAVNVFNEYINDIAKLKTLSVNATNMVDGLGCQRIIQKLVELST